MWARTDSMNHAHIADVGLMVGAATFQINNLDRIGDFSLSIALLRPSLAYAEHPAPSHRAAYMDMELCIIRVSLQHCGSCFVNRSTGWLPVGNCPQP